VLEDDERLGVLTVKALCRQGIAAVLATSIDPALRLAAAGAVLVADLSALASVPQELLEALRAAGPLVVSGASSADARAMADGVGARGFFLKPVDTADLAAAVRARQAAAGV
jgi:DNA-binding response OmpR family regulator